MPSFRPDRITGCLGFALLFFARPGSAQGLLLPGRTSTEVIAGVLAGGFFILAVLFVLWRLKREQKQEEKTSELSLGLQALPVPLAVLDERARITEANTAWRRLFGWDEENMGGLRLAQLIHPADVEEERKLFNSLQSNLRQEYECSLRFYTRNQQLLQGQLAVSTLSPHTRRSEGGGEPQAFAIARVDDLTRVYQAETERQSARSALHELYSVVVRGHLDMGERMRSMLEMGCRRFGVETGLVARVRHGQFEILQVISPDERLWRGQTHAVDQTESTPGKKTPVVHHALQQVAGAQEGKENPWRSFVEKETYLGLPICVEGRVYGVLGFFGCEPRGEEFEASDLEMLQLMADWLGGEIERQQARRQVEIKQEQLEAKQQELVEANMRLEELATRDGLTGVYNRRFLDLRLDEEIARAHRYGTPLSFIMLDVDKFKQYNDTFGHPAGDEVLRKISKLLQNNVRAIDIVARYGGEEFAIILPNTAVEGAQILGERLRSAVEVAAWPERAVTASFGISSLSDEITGRVQLASSADGALYHSKEQGRNRITHAQDVKTDAENVESVAAV